MPLRTPLGSQRVVVPQGEEGSIEAREPRYVQTTYRAATIALELCGCRAATSETLCAVPVEQVATFKLIVNQRTARALDLNIPNSFLQRADEVIK